jgi:AbiV family abortive infection protein
MGRGILAANRNARRLLGDAIVLFEAGGFPSATALAVLALEELVKWDTLLRVAILADEKQIESAWKKSRQHEVKLAKVFKMLASALEASGVEHPTVSIEMIAKATHQLKLRSIYTAFVTGREWVEPSSVSNAEECREFLAVALMITTGHFRITGKRLGKLVRQVPGMLVERPESAAILALLAWSEGSEAASLARDDDTESDAFRLESKGRVVSASASAERSAE